MSNHIQGFPNKEAEHWYGKGRKAGHAEAAEACDAAEDYELRKENEALKAYVERLRNHLIEYGSSQWWADEASRIIKETPQQSLAAIKNEMLEKEEE